MIQKRPSDLWNGPERLEHGSGPFSDRIRHVLDSANLEHLEHQALAIRKSLEPNLDDTVKCSIDRSVFAFGLNNVVFEVAFSDNVYWVAKVQHVATKEPDTIYMLSEISTMRLVRERTTIPVPRVFGFQTSSSDDFEFPYILMEFLPGRDVGRRFALNVPAEFLPKVAKQLADVLVQLETKLSFAELGILWRGADCEGPPRIMSLPSKKNGCDPDHLLSMPNDSPRTSLEWLQKYRREENKKVLKEHRKNPEWNTACWVLKDATSRFIVDDRVHGPFPLCHVDFHHGNLLFDDEFNLTGVIDWRHAQTVPLERLGLSPEFVAGPLMPDELKKTIAEFVDLIRASLQDLERSESDSGNDSRAMQIGERSRGDESEAESGSGDGVDAGDLPRAQKTRLGDIFGTTKAQIAYRCTLSNPRVALDFAQRVHELVSGEDVSWEQMVLAHGKEKLH